jgi:enterochelin esterase-like enzyme
VKISLRAILVLGCLVSAALLDVARAVDAAPSAATNQTAAPVARPEPPTRAADGPGAPTFIVVGAKPGDPALRAAAGANPPADADGDFLVGPDYLPAPELTPVAGVPQGTVGQFTMDSADSKFYPGVAREAIGTVDPANPKTLIVHTHAAAYRRTITVYIPGQYVRGTPAPFIVTHDGPALGKSDPTLTRILDNLIAQHRVPAMIAIMVGNGGGDAQGSQRGLEYDTMSGKFAEFIQVEVLPAVEKTYGVTLTKDPKGRATMGGSSGGSAAFMMAWYHPEWYRRVITYSGTYVNQQWPFDAATPGGAWDFHATLIPQNPPKPIRVWMEVGDRDFYNPNALRDGMHDWVDANHRMAAALKAKGYHYQYVFAVNAGHVDGRVREQTLPEALEWAWRGYPIAK